MVRDKAISQWILFKKYLFSAAGMTVRSLYLTGSRGQTNEAFWMHYIFADGSGSDMIAIWRVYRVRNKWKNSINYFFNFLNCLIMFRYI